MTPVITIRPQPDCDATVAAARAMGLEAQGFPLFTVEPLAWDAPDPASFDALLLGSANALRHGGAALGGYAGKPAYAVGETTAEAARAAGFGVVATGHGGLQAVLDCVRPEHARLLRLAGQERVELSPPPGIGVVERTLYALKPRPLPPELALLLRGQAIVLLHSAAAARHFSAACDALGIDRSHLSLVTIGPRVAEVAGSGWARSAAAASADDDAMLALAQRMCQEARGSAQG